MEIADTSVASGLPAQPDSPAPVADAQKTDAAQAADSPAPDADDQNPEPETPEQIEERKQSRRARARERQAADLAAAKTEARLLREQLAQRDRPQQQASTEPKREQFESLEDYYDARATHRARVEAERIVAERFQAQQGNEQQRRQAQSQADLAKTWDTQEKEFQKSAKDYTDVVTPFLDEGLQELHPDTRKAIVEIGPSVLYNLANLADTNPQEWARIVSLSPARQTAELGKLEALAPRAVKVSSAPTPARPAGSGRSGQVDPSKMNDEEYRAYRKRTGARWAN